MRAALIPRRALAIVLGALPNALPKSRSVRGVKWVKLIREGAHDGRPNGLASDWLIGGASDSEPDG